MKLSQSKIALCALVAAIAATSTGCGAINRIRAKNEINEAARTYKEGKFKEAEQHSRRALELDENQKTAPIFIARTVHAQYRQGVDTPENVAKADQAIAEYRKIYEAYKNERSGDEAYNAIAALYKALGRNEELRKWIETRAYDESVAADKRSLSYTFLASEEWNCSFAVTENKANQQTANENGKVVIKFKKPQDQAEYDKAKGCMTKGMELANKAIELDPNNERAWGFKTNLLLEARKLAEMDGKTAEAEQFAKQADEAQQKTTELNAKKKEEEAKKKAAAAQQQPAG